MTRVILPLVLLAAIITPVFAADHFPLTNDTVRTYRYYLGSENGNYTTRMDGWAVLGADSVHVYRIIGGPDDGIVEYWSENGEHDKFLHGIDDAAAGSSARFDPPILVIDEPLFVGKKWQTASRFGSGWLQTSFEATFIQETVTGAGTFQAFEISGGGVGIDEKQSGFLTVLGARRYAEGVGFVYSWDQGSARFDVLRVVGPTPLETVTWGRVKELFR